MEARLFNRKISTRYKPPGLPGESDDIERFEWVSRWLGLKEPEAEVLFDLGRPHIVSTKDEHGKWTDTEE